MIYRIFYLDVYFVANYNALIACAYRARRFYVVDIRGSCECYFPWQMERKGGKGDRGETTTESGWRQLKFYSRTIICILARRDKNLHY